MNDSSLLSLVPAATDAICRLQHWKRLVGRTRACQWPPIVRKTRVIANTAEYPSGAPSLKNADVVPDIFIVPKHKTFEDLEDAFMIPPAPTVITGIKMIGILSKIIRAPNGEQIEKTLTRRLRAVTDRIEAKQQRSKRPKLTVCVIQGLVGGMLYGGGYWIKDAISLAGGTPLFCCVGGPPRIFLEDILTEKPDILIIAGSGSCTIEEELASVEDINLVNRLDRASNYTYMVSTEGGDVSTALSAAGKEGGAFCVSAVEAIAETIHSDLFGNSSQLFLLHEAQLAQHLMATRNKAISKTALKMQSMCKPPEGSQNPSDSRSLNRSSHTATHKGKSSQTNSKTSKSRSRKERKSFLGFEDSSSAGSPSQQTSIDDFYQRSHCGGGIDQYSESPPSRSSTIGGTSDNADDFDQIAFVTKHVGYLRRGEVEKAKQFYHPSTRKHLSSAALADLKSRVRMSLHIDTPHRVGIIGSGNSYVLVPVTLKDEKSLMWRTIYADGQWWVDAIIDE